MFRCAWASQVKVGWSSPEAIGTEDIWDSGYLQKLLVQKIFGTEVSGSEAIEHICLKVNVAQLSGVLVQLSGSYCGATVWWYYCCIE